MAYPKSDFFENKTAKIFSLEANCGAVKSPVAPRKCGFIAKTRFHKNVDFFEYSQCHRPPIAARHNWQPHIATSRQQCYSSTSQHVCSRYWGRRGHMATHVTAIPLGQHDSPCKQCYQRLLLLLLLLRTVGRFRLLAAVILTLRSPPSMPAL